MAKMGKNVVDADLRARVFEDLIEDSDYTGIAYQKINDRQYGCILTDKNGTERYVRIGVIVAEEREDMTAQELMRKEIDAYLTKQQEKAEKAKANQEKAARDKARREAKAKEAQENA